MALTILESTQIKVAQILVHISFDVQLSVCHNSRNTEGFF